MSLLLLLAVATSSAAKVPMRVPMVAESMRVANAAFEYRDFDRVIELLDPLMHPVVLIPGDDQQLVARRLLGVSRLINGEMRHARDEFSQLLLIDPEHQLDPTKIPPQVIDAFEKLRDEMRPVLDELLRSRKKIQEPVLKVDREDMFLPFGVPQFKLQQWGAGYAFAGLQLTGLAINIGGWASARAMYPDDPRRDTALTVMYGGLATWIGSYLASVLIGNVLLPTK